MTHSWRNYVLTATLALGLAPVAVRALTPPRPVDTVYTGIVSDDMCGAKHDMGGGTPAECTRMCVKGGSDYALVVGEKAYTLVTTDKQQLVILDKYAGARVTVRGTLSGTKLTVHSVSPAR